MAIEAVPTVFGVPTKYLSLIILVIQNSALVLTMRYSRIQPGPRYLSSTAVVVSEVLKCTICLLIHLREQFSKPSNSELPLLSEEYSSGSRYGLKQLWTDVFSAKSGFFKLLVPAILYTLQNNLQFVAATNLDAATFQVTYQCKILTTALFAVMLLRQSLSWKKWTSLFILTIGVACVQIPSGQAVVHQQGNYFLGIVAVAIACLCSGFAGVYFEKVLKNGNSTSIWIRNIQLSVGCLAIAVAGTLAWDGKAIQENGFFQGYSPIVVGTICVQAAGGLIVAMVIKYADNILKGFATSLSIILSTVASVFIFDFIVTIYFLIGSIFVFYATYLYSQPDSRPASEMLEMSDEEKPMLEVDNFDEKPSRKASQQSFHDESDPELGSSVNTSRRQSNDFQEAPKREVRVLDELGHVG